MDPKRLRELEIRPHPKRSEEGFGLHLDFLDDALGGMLTEESQEVLDGTRCARCRLVKNAGVHYDPDLCDGSCRTRGC